MQCKQLSTENEIVHGEDLLQLELFKTEHISLAILKKKTGINYFKNHNDLRVKFPLDYKFQ